MTKIFTKLLLFMAIFCVAANGWAQNFNVTFSVDMSQYVGLNDTVYVNGTWNSWCGRCNPLTKQGSTNIWSGTISIPSGAQEFKYTIGGWNAQENLSQGSSCTKTTGGFTNRALNLTANTVMPTVCWQSCAACSNTIPMDLPITFDSAIVDYVLSDFGGDSSYVTADPVVSTNKVAKTVKTATAELWAGTTIGTAAGFAKSIPFASNANNMTLRVFSPDTGIVVKLKVEDAVDGTKSVETDVKTTVKNAWQTLTFDFSKHSTGTSPINYTISYKKASVFFNFGVTGATAGRKEYYFDDLKFVAPSAPAQKDVALPIYFDSANVNYVFADFGGNTTTLANDPTNSLNKVAQSIKSNVAELWAGTTMSGASGLASVIPFASGSTRISMKVYSPDTGIVVKLKAEDPNDPTKSVETDLKTTLKNSWETLVFDFSKQATGTAPINFSYTYKKLSVFFNFGITGALAGTKTYYWDNVEFVNTPPPPPTKVNVAFTVDAKNMNLAATDSLTLNGTFNGWCGACNKMTKVAGTNMWTTSLSLDPNTEYEYKFTVGNWVKQENLATTLSCTKTTGTFTNRLYKTKTTNDSLAAVCWESCELCPKNPPVKTKVTFMVNMKDYTKDMSKGVTLNGTFNAWCGNCTPMTLKGNKMYTVDVAIDTGEYDFKFTLGNWDDQEQFDTTYSCTKTTGTFTNRNFRVNDTNAIVIGPFCWNTCSICNSTTGISEDWMSNLKIYPNPATDNLKVDFGNLAHQQTHLEIYNTIGEQVAHKSYGAMDAGVQDLDIRFLAKGIYLIRISSEQMARTLKIQVD